MKAAAIFASAIICFAPSSHATDPPKRIVSMNVCTDQLLLDVADPESIISLSHLSIDPLSSNRTELAQHYDINHGLAEEIVSLDPELILAGSYTTPQTVQLLKTLGYRVESFDPAYSIQGIIDNYMRMGQLAAQPEKAAIITTKLKASLENTKPEAGIRPIFAHYTPNGWTSGPGSLWAEIAVHTGFQTVPEALGKPYTIKLSLEDLLVVNPDIIDLGDDYRDPPSRATLALAHPALKHLMERSKTVNISGRETLCGTSDVSNVLRVMAAAHKELTANE